MNRLLLPKRWAATIQIAAVLTLLIAGASLGIRVLAHPQSVAAQAALPPPVKAVGSKNAPITMEVFGDFECPSCRALYQETLRPMMSSYVESGKVYLVHYDFPLTMHRYSWEAARWADAAAEIGKYLEVEAVLYDNQDSWAADGNIEKYVAQVLSPTDLKRVEKILAPCQPGAVGLRPVNFDNSGSINDGCPVDKFIAKDYDVGKQIPVQATPTYVFIYKGQKYPAGAGIVAWPLLKQFFDQLLKS